MSAKKLVQARLPFKTLVQTPTSGKSAAASIGETISKRSHEKSDSEEVEDQARKVQKVDSKSIPTEINDRSSSSSKENINKIVSPSKPEEKIENEVVILSDDSDVKKEDKKIRKKKSNQAKSPKTPSVPLKRKSKGAGTPQSANKNIQIKLPVNSGKKGNKRRKSDRMSLNNNKNKEQKDQHDDSSDDVEFISAELHPQKRAKIDTDLQNEGLECNEPQPEAMEIDEANNSKEQISVQTNSNDLEKEKDTVCKESNLEKDTNETSVTPKKTILAESKKATNVDEQCKQKDKPKSQTNQKDAVSDVEADDESEEGHDLKEESNNCESETILKSNNTPQRIKSVDSKETTAKKALTPKQMKIMEQRRLVREEKNRLLEEKKKSRELMEEQRRKAKEEMEEQKRKAREELEEQRRKAREELEEQKRKQREEKDEQKRKEREEKEKKRIAECEAKNEEKRKRNEAKEEELRKKEEERKRKEQASAQVKESFKRFFVRVANDGDTEQTEHNNHNQSKKLAFRPFEIKGDMKLAPLCRKQLSTQARSTLESFLPSTNQSDAENEESEKKEAAVSTSSLYLTNLKTGKEIPSKCGRTITSDDAKKEDDDVQIIEDGQEIVEEIKGPVELHRAKFLKFKENRRPPYYGTWRKKSTVITPRRPFAQDPKYFDYEVDSDLEWEEEEPGESLDGTDDEKDKESEEDDYEVDNEWFVPHGHLSDEEMQNDEEFGLEKNNDREAQQAKLKVLAQEFAQEMKKKTEKLKPRLIGCIWVDENGNKPEFCPQIIWDKLDTRAMQFRERPIRIEPEVPEKSEHGSPSSNDKTNEKQKSIVLTDDMLRDLIRLVHGNSNSKNFLINEFIAYISDNQEAIRNGSSQPPLKTTVRGKIEEFATWQVVEANNGTQQSKKKSKKRLCWVVANETLKRMSLDDLNIQNNWQYKLQPKVISAPTNETDTETNLNTSTAPVSVSDADVEEANLSETDTGKNKRHFNIKRFTKVLTPDEKAKQLQDIRNTLSPITVSTIVTPVKKRVALLKSVPLGQKFAHNDKAELVNKLLKRNSDTAALNVMQDDDPVLILD